MRKAKNTGQDDQNRSDNQHRVVVLALRELHAQWAATVRMQLRLTNQARALVRRFLGWQVDMPEDQRANIRKAAKEACELIEAGKDLPAELAGCQAAAPFVLKSSTARAIFDSHRLELEKKMTELVESLPVWTWAEGIRGFGAKGLASIIGEAGDLADYPNPAKLWKRLGLAPRDEYRSVTKDGEPCFKFPKARRSMLFIVGDCLIKGNKDGEYRTLYLTKKAYVTGLHPDWSKMKCHRWAQKYIEKRLILNLWRAWRGQSTDGTHFAPAPAPAISPNARKVG